MYTCKCVHPYHFVLIKSNNSTSIIKFRCRFIISNHFPVDISILSITVNYLEVMRLITFKVSARNSGRSFITEIARIDIGHHWRLASKLVTLHTISSATSLDYHYYANWFHFIRRLLWMSNITITSQ